MEIIRRTEVASFVNGGITSELRGSGSLLLGRATREPFEEGDVVRFAEGDVHGLENTGPVEFVYLSVTSPPVNFRSAYASDWQAGSDDAA